MLTLEIATLVYLVLPVMLFAVTWLKWSVGLPFLLILSIGTFLFLQGKKDSAPAPELWRFPSRRTFWMLGALALLWCAFSGIGGWGVQQWDYFKHNAVLHDLIQNPWPVRYTSPGGAPNVLCYYLAYYLFPAMVGKVFGWAGANHFHVLYAACGVWLVFLWVAGFCRGRSLAAFLFIFAGGLKQWGHFILHGFFLNLKMHPEWWAGFFQYSSNFTLIHWAPNQSIAGWLVSALFAQRLITQRLTARVFWLCALVLFWSPWVSGGIFLLAVLFMPASGWIPSKDWLYGSLGLIVLAVLGSYYAAALPRVQSLWSFREGPLPVWIGHYAVFYFCEVGAYGVLVFLLEKHDPYWRMVLKRTMILLALLPFYKSGQYNDWCMRVSIPALFLLWIAVLRTLTDSRINSRFLLACLFGVGALTGVGILCYSWPLHPGPPEMYWVRTIPTLYEKDSYVVNYYLVPASSAGMKVLLRQ